VSISCTCVSPFGCISRNAAPALRAGGFMALETDGGEQADVVAAFVESVCHEGGPQEMAFERVAVESDCQGVRRFVTAWRTGHYFEE
jgi:methylase of polypeptide subunit release factors